MYGKGLHLLAGSVILSSFVSAARAEPAVEGASSAAEIQIVHRQMERLDSWLDTNSTLPPAKLPVSRLAFVDAGQTIFYEGQMTEIEGKMRGLYDAATATIFLVRPWSGASETDRGVLLHEMVHHRQTALYWHCPHEQEWDAYKIQDQYLNENGEQSGFNWFLVALSASCSRRDIFPD